MERWTSWRWYPKEIERAGHLSAAGPGQITAAWFYTVSGRVEDTSRVGALSSFVRNWSLSMRLLSVGLICEAWLAGRGPSLLPPTRAGNTCNLANSKGFPGVDRFPVGRRPAFYEWRARFLFSQQTTSYDKKLEPIRLGKIRRQFKCIRRDKFIK